MNAMKGFFLVLVIGLAIVAVITHQPSGAPEQVQATPGAEATPVAVATPFAATPRPQWTAAQQKERIAKSMRLVGRVSAIRDDGLLLICPQPRELPPVVSRMGRVGGGANVYSPGPSDGVEDNGVPRAFGTVLVQFHPQQDVLYDGVPLDLVACPVGVAKVKGRTLQRFEYIQETKAATHSTSPRQFGPATSLGRKAE
jgi:hypothetical protein